MLDVRVFQGFRQRIDRAQTTDMLESLKGEIQSFAITATGEDREALVCLMNRAADRMIEVPSVERSMAEKNPEIDVENIIRDRYDRLRTQAELDYENVDFDHDRGGY